MLYLLSLLFATTNAAYGDDPECNAIVYGDGFGGVTVYPAGSCLYGGTDVSYQYVCSGDIIKLNEYESSDCSGGATRQVGDVCGSGVYSDCTAYCSDTPCQVVTFKQYIGSTCDDTDTATPSLHGSFIANYCDEDGEIYACSSDASGNVTKETYDDDTCSGNSTASYDYSPCYSFGSLTSTYLCAMATDTAAYFKIIGAFMVVFVASLF